jgi:DNA-binding XRE family transcriptional regulator
MKVNELKEYHFEDLLKQRLKNKVFRNEYADLAEEFELAEEIIRLRVEKNMTQKDLARMAGTSQPAIARIESGRYNNVSMTFLKRIGKALDAIPEIHFKKAE